MLIIKTRYSIKASAIGQLFSKSITFPPANIRKFLKSFEIYTFLCILMKYKNQKITVFLSIITDFNRYVKRKKRNISCISHSFVK